MSAPVISIDSPRRYRWIALLVWLSVCFLVAGVSTLFTASAIPGWYAGLAKPAFNPPNEIFGPVWTLLYALMAVAAWLVWLRAETSPRVLALMLFCVQLVLNFGWTWIFFGNHMIGFAFVEIVLLWITILATAICFFPLSRWAGWLMLPYLAWVTFASLLNWEIWRLN